MKPLQQNRQLLITSMEKIKVSHKERPSVEDYWSYCNEHQCPHIKISSKGRDYATIAYDLLPCLNFHQLSGDVSEPIVKMYEAYIEFFQVPKTKFEYAGGSINLVITVHKEHAEFIADRQSTDLQNRARRERGSFRTHGRTNVTYFLSKKANS
jgi:hypothetical protein